MRALCISAIALTLSALLLCGCQERVPETPATETRSDATAQIVPADWKVISESELNDGQTQKRDLALLARDELFQQLKGRLMEVVGNDGPAKAISVCKSDAPKFAAEIGEKHGVTISRTSHRLRNPKNAPPPWAVALVEDRVEEATFLASGDQLAALLPIRLSAPCLTCHGPKEKIATEISDALATDYPDDKATGFEVDALRGWFWVEVP